MMNKSRKYTNLRSSFTTSNVFDPLRGINKYQCYKHRGVKAPQMLKEREEKGERKNFLVTSWYLNCASCKSLCVASHEAYE